MLSFHDTSTSITINQMFVSTIEEESTLDSLYSTFLCANLFAERSFFSFPDVDSFLTDSCYVNKTCSIYSIVFSLSLSLSLGEEE